MCYSRKRIFLKNKSINDNGQFILSFIFYLLHCPVQYVAMIRPPTPYLTREPFLQTTASEKFEIQIHTINSYTSNAPSSLGEYIIV